MSQGIGDPLLVATTGDYNLDIPEILCVVRDHTSTATQQKFARKYRGSMRTNDLVKEVADELQYEPDSFLLVYDKNSTEEVYVNDLIPQTLLELFDGIADKRQSFMVREKDDGQAPVKRTVDTNDALTSSATSSCYASSSNIYYGYTGMGKSPTGYVGLVNQSMTCYLNSLLQALYMTPEFRNAIYRWKFTGPHDSQRSSIPYQLQKLFLLLQTSSKRAVETKDITNSFGWDSSESYRQHDIQELCRVMFDALEKCWRDTKQKTLIKDLYEGNISDCVKCLECKTISSRDDVFLDVSLTIQPFGSDKTYGSVREALLAFIEPELLEGNNQYFCEKCNKKCDAHKMMRFTKLPYLLTLHLNRFAYDPHIDARRKLNDKVTFPDILNLNDIVGQDSEDNDNIENGNKFVNDLVMENGDATEETVDADEQNHNNDLLLNGMNSAHAPDTENNRYHRQKSQGQYVYELFAIMIHSGSALGGHYYAYIKNLKNSQWFKFDDQSVIEINQDDIRRTYGGSTGYSSYSSYTSSANAYMLMYRQMDHKMKEGSMDKDQLPEHIKDELEEMIRVEKEEKRLKDIESRTCKIKLLCFHPGHQKMVELSSFAFDKSTTLSEATEKAWKELHLDGVVPLDCVRLVKYDEQHDWIKNSFENTSDTPMGTILGGVKSYYLFELMMETKASDSEFVPYSSEDIAIVAYSVDIKEKTINILSHIRESKSLSLTDLREIIAQDFSTDDNEVAPSSVRMVLETYHNEQLKFLEGDMDLYDAKFTQSNKIFVECSGSEQDVPFKASQLCQVLVSFQNTISFTVALPAGEENGSPLTLKPEKFSRTVTFVEDDKMDPVIPTTVDQDNVDQDTVVDYTRTSSVEEVPAYVICVEDQEDYEESQPDKDEMLYDDTFTTKINIDTTNHKKSLECFVDRRITVGRLKYLLSSFVDTTPEQFRIFHIDNTDHEAELTYLSDTLSKASISDRTKLTIRMGRALRSNEKRIQVYELHVDRKSVSRHLFEAIISTNTNMQQLKLATVKALKQKYNRDISINRCRLRKKLHRSPGAIYLKDEIVSDKLFTLGPDLYMQELKEDELVLSRTEIALFIRRWRSEEKICDPVFEIVMNTRSKNEMIKLISQHTNIPEEFVSFAKSRNSIPASHTHYELDKTLSWDPACEMIISAPMHVFEDGQLIYCRDNREDIAEVNEQESRNNFTSNLQNDIQSARTKITGATNNSYSSSSRYSRKEKALTIMTHDSTRDSTEESASSMTVADVHSGT